jgi:hypothetical protein
MTSPEHVPSAANAPAPASARPFPLGLVSFIAGAAANLLQFLMQFAFVLLVSSVGYMAVQPVQLVVTVIAFVLGAAAVIIGILALLQKHAPRGLAAAGTALGAVVVVGAVVSLIQGLLLNLV